MNLFRTEISVLILNQWNFWFRFLQRSCLLEFPLSLSIFPKKQTDVWQYRNRWCRGLCYFQYMVKLFSFGLAGPNDLRSTLRNSFDLGFLSLQFLVSLLHHGPCRDVAKGSFSSAKVEILHVASLKAFAFWYSKRHGLHKSGASKRSRGWVCYCQGSGRTCRNVSRPVA